VADLVEVQVEQVKPLMGAKEYLVKVTQVDLQLIRLVVMVVVVVEVLDQ
jgi:hypothetical protein